MTLQNAFGNLATDATVQAGTTQLHTDLTQGDGGATLITGVKTKFRDGFTTGTVATPVDPAVWTLVNEAPDTGNGQGHLVLPGGDSQGASYLRVSLSPFVAGSSVHLSSVAKFPLPIRHAWGISASQRIIGQEVAFGLAEALDSDATLGLNRLAQPADLPIVGTVTTTGSVQTMVVTGHGLKGNDRVIVVGNAEKRLDVGPVYVTVVDANTITVPNTLAAATYTAGGVVRVADPTGLLNNAALQLWGDNNVVTNATFVARRNGTKYRVLIGQGAASSVPTQINSSPYSDAWLANGPSEIWANLDEVVWRSWGDGTFGTAGYGKFQQSIPDENQSYRLYSRAKNLDNLSRPIARIVSAAKTGTTTTTITTDVPHGLIVGDQVGVVGIRDQPNFGATTSQPVLTTPTATTFTVAFGAAATASDALGGSVWQNRGGVASPGTMTQAVQSIASTVAGVLAVVGNAAWSGASPGDYVNLHGLNGAGAAGYEGAYRVLRLTGTTLELAFTGGLFGSITTGGSVIRRTDVRLHFARLLGHSRVMTEVIGGRGSTSDQNNAVPVSITSASTLNINANATQFTPVTAVAEVAPLSSTNLGVSAVYTQTAIDTGTFVPSRYNSIRLLVSHLAGQTHGHLTIEQSADNSTFRESHRIPVPSDGGYHSFDLPLLARYYRVKFTNGVTAQTSFWLQAMTYRGEPQRDQQKVLAFPMTPAAGVALAISGTLTSPTIDLGTNHQWSTIRLWSASDQAVATNGLRIEQSPDGTNWLTYGQQTPGGAPWAGEVVQNIHQRYVRGVLANNATTASTASRMSMTLVSL